MAVVGNLIDNASTIDKADCFKSLSMGKSFESIDKFLSCFMLFIMAIELSGVQFGLKSYT